MARLSVLSDAFVLGLHILRCSFTCSLSAHGPSMFPAAALIIEALPHTNGNVTLALYSRPEERILELTPQECGLLAIGIL